MMMALTPKRLFLYLCISISLLRPYTLFSRSPLVNKTLFDRQSVLKHRENNFFFLNVTVAWTNYVRDTIPWFLHKFNVDLQDTLRAFKTAARSVLRPATAPLLNPTPVSVHWPQPLRAFPFSNGDIIMDGLCQKLPAYQCCSCGRCFIQR